ncbi:MAG: hypothetical protein U9O78_00110 [Patescibacteria group bacterium]|nr:hypothetical protein [Patescibacteria group bacterium]
MKKKSCICFGGSLALLGVGLAVVWISNPAFFLRTQIIGYGNGIERFLGGIVWILVGIGVLVGVFMSPPKKVKQILGIQFVIVIGTAIILYGLFLIVRGG